MEWHIKPSPGGTGAEQPIALRRTLSLFQLVLYGMGTTIGAGVYALIGEITNVAGYLAPWSFTLAAILALFTAISFAELSSRYPRTAGIAYYVQTGFQTTQLARITGLLAVAAGLVSSAALLNGFVGYLQEFLLFSRYLIIPIVCVLVCVIACWGIKESIWLAGGITLIEVGGLVWATTLATGQAVDLAADPMVFFPSEFWHLTPAVLSGAVLAFYAYIGFEDMVEVAEEVVNVRKNLPRAILITLAASTVLYIALSTSALLATSPEFLAASTAPLADLFRAVGSTHPKIIAAIGLLAIINGVLIQVVMASRIFYGLANRRQLPVIFARLHPQRQTPMLATITATTIVTFIALLGSIAGLAELTSSIILIIFALVNTSLVLIELRAPAAHKQRLLMCSALFGATICIGLFSYTAVSWLISLL